MEAQEEYIKAGKIAAKVREQIRGEVMPGVKAIDICERVENLTRQLGGGIAFPCDVNINQVAAHYCSPVGDQTTIRSAPSSARIPTRRWSAIYSR